MREVLLWDLNRSTHAPVHFSLPYSSRGRGRFGPDGRSVLTATEEGAKLKMLRWSGRDFRERETLAEIPLSTKSSVQTAPASLEEPSPFDVDDSRSALEFNLEQMQKMNPAAWWAAAQLAIDPDQQRRKYDEPTGSFLIVREHATRTLVATFQLSRLRLRGAAVSFDGRRLAVCSEGTEPLKLFDMASGRELLSLGDGTAGLWLVGFSPDGSTVGARARDGTLHLWSAPSWAEIAAAETAAASR